MCSEEAGAPLLQAVSALLGLTLCGTTTTNEPPLKLHLILVHQKKLSEQGVSLWRGDRAGRKMGKVIINLIRCALPPPARKDQRKGRSYLRETGSPQNPKWTMDFGDRPLVRCKTKLNVHPLGQGWRLSGLG